MPAPTIPDLRVPIAMLGGGPARVNECDSPSFEDGTLGGWGTTASFWIAETAVAEVVKGPSYDGDYSAKVVCPGSKNNEGIKHSLAVVKDEPKTVSVYVRGDVGGEEARLGVGDSEHGNAESGLVTLTTGQTRLNVTLTPTGSGASGMAVLGPASKKAQTFYIDAILFEPGASLGPYFPRASQIEAGRITWAGSVGASASTLASPPAIAATVEQGSVEEIEQCVDAVLHTIVGSRIDSPSYGIPDELFQQLGPNESADTYLAAVEAAEPRAHLIGRARIEEMVKRVTIEGAPTT